MKSRIGNSYYMGISYRSTNRPQLQFSLKTGLKTYHVSLNPLEKQQQEQQTIIHKNKKRRVKQIIKNYNPFLARKTQKQIKRNKQIDKSKLLPYESEEFFKVIKINKAKTQGNEEKQKINEQLAVSIVLPEKQKKITLQQKQINVELAPVKKTLSKPQNAVSNQQNAIFNHFPSQLFLKPQRKRSKNYYYSEAKQHSSNSNRSASFFFPSNKVKINNQKDKQKKFTKQLRPKTSSIHYPKNLHDNTKYFNFDGTLQNHQIAIPERPKTSVIKTRHQRKYSRDIHYSNYQTIAKNCIKLKNSKGNQPFDKSLKLQPWGTQNQQKIIDLFDISYSSIKDQLIILK